MVLSRLKGLSNGARVILAPLCGVTTAPSARSGPPTRAGQRPRPGAETDRRKQQDTDDDAHPAAHRALFTWSGDGFFAAS